MIDFYKKFSTIRNIIGLSLLVILANIAFHLGFREISQPIPDMLFFYNSTTIFNIISGYSEYEIGRYIRVVLILDFIYPIAYAFLLSFILFILSRKPKISSIPFLILFFDFSENMVLLTLFYNYPLEFRFLATVAGFFTMMKWVLLIIVVIMILTLLLKKIILKFKPGF